MPGLVQEIVDEYHSRFCDIVALHRKLSKARVRELADGRIYSASKAVAAGLVDEIGYLEEARLTVQALVGTKDVCYIRYEPKRDFSGGRAAMTSSMPEVSESPPPYGSPASFPRRSR